VVPNDFNALQRAAAADLGRKPWWIVPPHHLNYFDFDSLGRLLRRVGFILAGRTTTFPMELFLLMGEDYTSDDQLGRALHAKRKRLERALAAAGEAGAIEALYGALAGVGLGRECVVFATRDESARS
jgi:ABC-type dipeptide/oligopeptide/nickel transport system permease subunit